MRVLHISSAKTFGGGERHLVDLCRQLTARGHEVFIAMRPTAEWRDRLDFIPPDRFLFVSIRNSFGMLSAKRIARLIEKENIELVHAHVARDYLAASVAVRSAKRARLVLTRHVMFPLKPFHRFALRNVDAAIAVSPPVSAELQRIFPPDKVHVIQNGIHLADVGDAAGRAAARADFRRLHSIPNDAPLVVTLGELKLLKGQRDFVLAAAEVVKQLPHCRFVIAGKDNSMDQRFRRELKRLAKVLGLEENILWLDWLDDVGPLLAAADIFVSPSHSESFGLAILEAIIAGTPVIATDTDGARQLVAVDESLVPIKDPLALAARICSYLDDPDELRSRFDEIRAAAARKFSIERMADETEALYSALLKQA